MNSSGRLGYNWHEPLLEHIIYKFIRSIVFIKLEQGYFEVSHNYTLLFPPI